MKNSKTIIATTTWMAGIASLGVIIILPLSYFTFSFQFLKGNLASEAEINSRIVTKLINANPTMWHFEQMRLEELLEKRPETGENESRRIVDLQGKLIAASDTPLPQPTLTISHDVLDSGLSVGRIEISRSLRPLILRTILATLGAALLGLALNITLRVLPVRAVIMAEKALREKGEFLDRVMQSTTNAIVVLDPDDLILHANHRCAEITGYTHDELIGHNFARLFPAEAFNGIREHITKIKQKQKPILGQETSWQRLDGGLTPISWGGAPLSRPAGHNGLVFTAEDISSRVKFQKEKDKLIEKLQSALSEIQILRGIIPICSYCKKIRNEEGVWGQLEAYIHTHSGAEFSHGVCPECYEKVAAEMDDQYE